MRIGMHVRGFEAGRPVAVQRALERGAECIQIFASNPRMWRLPATNAEADRELRGEMRVHDVRPLFIHLPYLVNLASPTRSTRERSRRCIEWSMERAEALGAAGVVVHAGSAMGERRAAALRRQVRPILGVLGEGGRGPRYLVELTAGGRGAVASRFEEAAELLDACDGHARLGICIDTCHLHAAGYELSTAPAVAEVVERLASQVGLGRLGLIHANDSRDSRDSRRDRHWHVGEGHIGLAGFRALLGHPLLQAAPIVCETPGDLADDRRNLARLRRMRDRPRTRRFR